jgi:phage tail-like protein
MAQNPALQSRTYAAAHFAFVLDGGGEIGLFRSIEGGNVKADVMTYQSGPIYDKWRQLGKPKFEDIKLTIGMAMGLPFYGWVSGFFDGKPDRRNGSIIAADFYYNERAKRTFTNAMISELTFPKLDAADKNAAYMTVNLAVEGMSFAKGDGSKLVSSKGFNAQKLWTACNFRFSIEGFEDACNRTSKIDSFTIKMNVLEYHAGGHRAPIKVPSPIDFPNLSFYIPEADGDKFFLHVQKRIIKEQSEQPGPGNLHGFIETYDNEGSPLFYLEFFGAEIIAITPDKSDSSTEEIKMLKIDLYTEKMSFTYSAMEVI